MRRLQKILTALAVLSVCGIVFFAIKQCRTDATVVSKTETKHSNATLVALKEIRQWEFLTIQDEEIIDTTRSRLFGDDTLIRIYYGTMHIGIDMGKLNEQSVKTDKEKQKITVVLPNIELLDERFIDEALTKSFYESGEWTKDDYKQMLARAKSKMKKRCLTEKNITLAQENARRSIAQILMAMGYKQVEVTTPNFDFADGKKKR
ncbi:MAG: DUF4230 domain-containing protein [Bacteroidaceae bacterium]|nr:DUF4230 domain-containing protein [Bacteroidaceae bacterium]